MSPGNKATRLTQHIGQTGDKARDVSENVEQSAGKNPDERRDEVLRRMLKTPPKPKGARHGSKSPGKPRKAPE